MQRKVYTLLIILTLSMIGCQEGCQRGIAEEGGYEATGTATVGVKWVGVGDGGYLLTSDGDTNHWEETDLNNLKNDNEHWRPQIYNPGTGVATIYTGVNLRDVHYANNTWVAVGTCGIIVSAIGGGDWVIRETRAIYDLQDLHYANNTWVAVGYYGILTSTDGISWTGTDYSNTAEAFRSVYYGNNIWVAVGERGTIYTSTDGISWRNRKPMGTAPVDSELSAVTYGGGKWVAVGENATILTSDENAEEWTERMAYTEGGVKIQEGNHLSDVAYGGGKWVAVGKNPQSYRGYDPNDTSSVDPGGGRILVSADGDTWTERDQLNTPTTFHNGSLSYVSYRDIHYANGTWVVVGGRNVATSMDGDIWVPSSLESGVSAVSYANDTNTWVAVGAFAAILTSPDGDAWAKQTEKGGLFIHRADHKE